MYKRQSFRNKPIRTTYYLFLLFIFLIFKIKKVYKIKIKDRKYLYTYKPYLKMGMGGRGQFVLREFYDPFLTYGLDMLPKKFNFIDVGCSRGFFTLFLSAVNSPESKGICIDPFDYALDEYLDLVYGRDIDIYDTRLYETESYKIGTTTYSDLKIPIEFINSIEDGSVEIRQAKLYITPDLIGDNQPSFEDEVKLTYAGSVRTGQIINIDTKQGGQTYLFTLLVRF